MNGLQDLIMFRDNIQQPEMTGMDNLRNLQSMTMQSMADQQYANAAFGGLVDNVIDPNEAMQYAASGGIVSLPLVQAGFGGFLKKAVRAFNKIPAAKLVGRTIIRPLSKSKLGNMALSVAPFLLPGNPVLTAAMIAAMRDPKGQGNPYKVIQAGAKAYAGQKLGEALQGAPGGSEGYSNLTQAEKANQLKSAIDSSAQAAGQAAQQGTTASSSIFGDIGKSLTDSMYDPQGTVLSRLGERIAGTGQFEGVGLREQLGLPPAATGAEGTNITDANTYQDVANLDPTNPSNLYIQPKPANIIAKEPTTFSKRLADSMPFSGQDAPGTLLGRELSNVPVLGKLIPESTAGQLALGGATLTGLDALQGQPQEAQYDPEVYNAANIETNFDKERMVYIDKTTGEEIPTQIALARLAEAYRSFDPRGKLSANIDSGIKTAFQNVAQPEAGSQPLGSIEELGRFAVDTLQQPLLGSKSGGMLDPVLRNSGGLIGMAYGGQMPQNGLDVRYKEFSGMVGGQGDGMRDNVYMPIVERDNGQQVATLAVSPKEYVVDANTMSLLGNGNPDEGAEIMDETIKDVRMAATGQREQQKEIDGLAALNRMRRV